MSTALRQTVQSVTDSHVTGHIVGGATMGAGWAEFIGFIPSTPTEVAACFGGLLSIVLIIKHIFGIIHERLEIKKERLEIAELIRRKRLDDRRLKGPR